MTSPENRTSSLRTRAVWLAGVIIAAAAVAGFFYYSRIAGRPVVSGIYPSIGEPGGIVTLTGRHFGRERGESRLEIDGVAPTESSYVSWNDSVIEVKLPFIVDSGLVYVITGQGRSNPRLYMNRERLPVAPSGAAAAKTGPTIVSLSGAGGTVGSVLSISGLNFGANRNESGVFFSWLAQTGFVPAQEQTGQGFVEASDADFGYEAWSDQEIRVRVPDGAVSGSVFVKTDKGSSDFQYFQIVDQPGTKTFRAKRTYTISYFVSIDKISATTPNDLYLWIPKPVEAAAQREVIVVNQSLPPLVPDYRGVSVYRLKDLPANGSVTVAQSFIVQVYEVDTSVQGEKIREPSEPKPLVYANHTQPDSRIPSSAPAIIALAKKLAGKEKNPHRIAKALYDGLPSAVSFSATHSHESPLEALADRTGDAYSLATLYCALLRASGVPALPVSGYLIGDDRSARRHYWVEYWLYGLGWIPVDPVLGSGAVVQGFVPPFEDRNRYFGDLDNRHLAFSRGVTPLSPMTPNGRIAARERQYSLQDLYEEASGGLSGYSAFWSDIEITGVY
ncbi:MAG: IPT/TIG domain-containing protein [Spirochaetes bacterium]|nr:IPT/TIG domain-containing protein [Spirochaetota bacterium]